MDQQTLYNRLDEAGPHQDQIPEGAFPNRCLPEGGGCIGKTLLVLRAAGAPYAAAASVGAHINIVDT